ncbi:MAG: hypothetical protein KY459_10935 [Acidobacteria bacterium]|nr:hypothetical protein [Acidobacteriota bacterium]
MRTLAILLILAIPVAVGCSDDAATESAQASADAYTPEQLAEIGSAVEADPASAESILADAGLTPEEFEQEVRRVTEDPDLSRRYASAYHAAK